MNNWRLLLLAVVVVVQPIGSFTESNLIDGRECCERAEDVRFYGTERRALNGNREDRRTTEKRRLDLFDERSMLSRSDRRLSLKPSRSSRDQAFRRATSTKIREDQSRNRDESRSSVGKIKRDSRESSGRDALDTKRNVRLTSDAQVTRSIRQSRDSVSRQPIRNSRDRQVSGKYTAQKRELEVVARSGTRRDTRLSGTRSDSGIQLEDNREQRTFDRNSQEDRENRRFSNQAQRAELRRRFEFRTTMITDNRNSERIRDSRHEHERLVQSRKDSRIHERLERQGRDEKRRFMDMPRNIRRLDSQLTRGSEGTTSTRNAERMERRSESQDQLREIHDARLTRHYEQNMHYQRTSRNRDETSDERRIQRGKRLATVSTDRTTSLNSDQRNGNDKMLDSRQMLAHRDNRESSEERRQERDNTKHTRERSVDTKREQRETERAESRLVNRGSSEERRLQRDKVLISRNQQNRYNERTDLRRRVLERSVERAIRMSRSAERRQDIGQIRAFRSADDIREVTKSTNYVDERQQIREQARSIEQRMTRETTSTQRHETRLSSTEEALLERVERNRYDVRGTDKRVVVRVTRNVASPQRIATRGSRTENIRLERLGRYRAEVKEKERSEVRRDNTRFDRRSSERVQGDRSHESRDSRNEMSRNREVRTDFSPSLSSRGIERVLTERMKNDREHTHVQEEIASNRNDVRVERTLSEQHQERERHSRDVTNEARIVEAERRVDNRIARDSHNVRGERNLEARRMLTRTRDNRDTSFVGDETRGQRGDSRRSMIIMQRNSRVPERLTERVSKPGPQNERITRNVEKQVQLDGDNRRESRIDMRSNSVRIQTTARLLKRDDKILKHEGDIRNVDVTPVFVESNEPVLGTWKLALYTLQGIYICGLLVQMLTENGSKTKKRTFNWWSTHKNLVKVD